MEWPALLEDFRHTIDEIIQFHEDEETEFLQRNKFNGRFFNSSQMKKHWKFSFHMASDPKRDGTGTCFTFNNDNDFVQTQPNMEGGLIIHLKKHQSKEHCFDAECGCYVYMIHAPGTIPVQTQGDICLGCNSLDIVYEYEEHINLPEPYGSCVNEFPQEMFKTFPVVERYNYSIKACFSFKYTTELPFHFRMEDLLDKDRQSIFKGVESFQCFPECFQRIYKIVTTR